MQEAQKGTQAHGHANLKTYLAVAAVLTVVTLMEFGMIYVPSLRPIMAAALILLSVGKFALVAMFFMHLKYEKSMLAGFFVIGIVLAAVIVMALKAVTWVQ